MLLTNPEVMKQLMEEQKKLTEGKSHIGYDEINEMTYLDACLKETLRLHPPLVMLVRRYFFFTIFLFLFLFVFFTCLFVSSFFFFFFQRLAWCFSRLMIELIIFFFLISIKVSKCCTNLWNLDSVYWRCVSVCQSTRTTSKML